MPPAHIKDRHSPKTDHDHFIVGGPSRLNSSYNRSQMLDLFSVNLACKYHIGVVHTRNTHLQFIALLVIFLIDIDVFFIHSQIVHHFCNVISRISVINAQCTGRNDQTSLFNPGRIDYRPFPRFHRHAFTENIRSFDNLSQVSTYCDFL